MDIKNELLENKDFVAKTLKSLIEREFERVVTAGLISKDECYAFIEKYKSSKEDLVQNLLLAYTSLSNIKLAGDKLEEDKFYDLNSILNKKEPVLKSECKCNPGECSGSDCPCEENCNCKNSKKLIVMLKKLEFLINSELEKVAYSIGRLGDHETAYKVERTLRDIKAKIQKGSIFNCTNNISKLAERNKILICEAKNLLSEFKDKFGASDYFQFVRAIRAEMRLLKNDNPEIAAMSLRSKWDKENISK